MKNTIRRESCRRESCRREFCWIIYALLGFIFYSCQEEDLSLPVVAGEGALQLKVNVGKENLINARSAATITDAFNVRLLSEANDTLYQWDNVKDVPETVKLKTGRYFVKVSSAMPSLPAFDAVYYTGVSEIFEIGDGQTSSVDVTVRLSNAKVSVTYTDSVKSNFYDYFVRITDAENNYLTFGKDEARAGYFNNGSLSAYVKLSYIGLEGDSLFYEKTQLIEGVQPNDHINITINADLNYGDGLFAVNTSDAVNKKDIIISLDETAAVDAAPMYAAAVDTAAVDTVTYSENLAIRGNGLAFASSFADDSMQYAQPKHDPVNDTIKMIYNLPTPDKAFDGRSSHWESNSHKTDLPQWLGFDFGAGQEKVIRQYSMYVTQWGTPKSWLFQGSNDGQNWDILDEKVDEALTTFETSNFTFDNQSAYRYYRLLVTKATGLTNSRDEKEVNFVLIRELGMREAVY